MVTAQQASYRKKNLTLSKDYVKRFKSFKNTNFELLKDFQPQLLLIYNHILLCQLIE